MNKITVFGTGYVGLVTGTCLADLGHRVLCVDIDESKIAALRAGKIPIFEPGLELLVKRNVSKGRLSFATDLDAGIQFGQFLFVAVGTPQDKTGQADLKYVLSLTRTIARHYNQRQVVVVKSTVPVGTNHKIQDILNRALKKRKIKGLAQMVSNPEFLREGSAIRDFFEPDRIVIGSEIQRAGDRVSRLYATLKAPIVRTSLKSSELIKYSSNAFLATRISFINEIARLCDAVGADITDVALGMGLDHRIGPHFLQAGLGYGGSCFPKDTHALVAQAKKAGVKQKIVNQAILVNREQKEWYYDKVIRHCKGGVSGKTIAVLGLAFKPDTDDLREAPSIDIVQKLLRAGATIQAYDPIAMGNAALAVKSSKFHLCTSLDEALRNSEVQLILTEWNEFKEMNLQRLKKVVRKPFIIDGRNIYNPKEMAAAGISYYGVGRAV